MLEVVVEIDDRPLSRWGCDGVVLRDADGLDGLRLLRRRADRLARMSRRCWSCRSARTPCSPGRWSSRPTRCWRSRSSPAPTAPGCCGATGGGRSTCRRARGSRYAARSEPVRLARLHQAPFTDRLVAKFDLPVQGWRGSAERRRRAEATRLMLEEIRIGQLGVIESSRLELGPGLTVDHRRDRRRQDDGGDRARAAARRPGRQRHGPHRRGHRAGRGRRRRDRARRVPGGGRRRRRRGRGRPRACSPATSRAKGRSRAWVGGASVPVSRLAELAERWWPCTASPTSTGCCASGRSARRWTGSAASRCWPWWRPTPRCTRGSRPTERELDEVVASARERAREADLLRFGLGEIEAVDPRPGEDAQLAADEARLGYADALRTAAEQAREALSSEAGDPDALGAASAARTAARGGPRARPGGRGAGRPAGRDRLPALRRGRRRRLLRRRRRRRPGPPGRACPSAGRR